MDPRAKLQRLEDQLRSARSEQEAMGIKREMAAIGRQVRDKFYQTEPTGRAADIGYLQMKERTAPTARARAAARHAMETIKNESESDRTFRREMMAAKRNGNKEKFQEMATDAEYRDKARR